MSQSATLYKITLDKFKEVVLADGKNVKPDVLSDRYSTFQGSFMALEHILIIGKDKEYKDLIKEIFNPKESIGVVHTSDINFEDLKQEELYGLLNPLNYIPSERVKQINLILQNISEEEVANKYDAKDLNRNGIYPEIWHDNNAENEAFNRRHLLEDFIELKNFFNDVAAEDNNVLVYIG